MHKRTRAAAVLLLAAAVLAAQPAAAMPTSAARPEATPHPGGPAEQNATDGQGRPRTVTLATGDRVTVNGELTATIEPGEGREGVTFTTEQRGGRLRVLPSDAIALLSDKRLDPRLFDVTGLLELG